MNTNVNVYEASARARKALRLYGALRVFLTDHGCDDAEIIAVAERMTTAAWYELARRADIHRPSEETIAAAKRLAIQSLQ